MIPLPPPCDNGKVNSCSGCEGYEIVERRWRPPGYASQNIGRN